MQIHSDSNYILILRLAVTIIYSIKTSIRSPWSILAVNIWNIYLASFCIRLGLPDFCISRNLLKFFQFV